MTSLLGVPPDLQGLQAPRVWSVPPSVGTAGDEAVELAAMAGLYLDPWQQFVLSNSLGERSDVRHSWAAFEVGLVVSRQNGKGGILEARELAGLFLLKERLIVHSAHQFDTSLEAFRRILALIEDTPEFDRVVRRVSRSHGEEGIELKTGQRLRFRTRTKGGGRGFTGDCLILDEAMDLPASAHGALLPTLSARPNPQVWYTGSAVDQRIHEHGTVFARIRERGHAGDPALAFFEWSADGDVDRLDDKVLDDPEVWRQANPALGIRISSEYVSRERRSMDRRTFAVERLGIGDWPATSEEGFGVISEAAWQAAKDDESSPMDPVCFAFDVTPDRAYAAIAVAGRRDDGRSHVEIVEHAPGTAWVAGRLERLVAEWKPAAVVCDPAGPAGGLLAEIAEHGVEVTTVGTREHGQACGAFFDAVVNDQLRHLGTGELRTAVGSAVKRPLGDAWAWNRKGSADICPLVAVTLAFWASRTVQETAAPEVWDLNEVVAQIRAERAAEEPPAPQPPGPKVPEVTFHPF